MLNRFFILIGTIVLSTITFFKNISFKEESTEETVKSIFSRIDFEKKTAPKDNDKLDSIREFLIPIMLKKTNIKIAIAMCAVILIIMPLEISAMFITILVMCYVFLIYYPKIKQQNSYSDLNQDLPYALRHMGIELKSGKGLHDTLITIRDANYGTFSKEVNRVLEEVKFGKPTEDALLEMSNRIKSEGLQRAIQQIIGTLRVGGSLSNSLEIIAKDISFEMQIKLKEYSQKLNSFILIYTFIAILAPVIILIMLMASSTVMGDVVSSGMLFIIYAVFFPMVVMFMGVFIKRLEPKV